jgi:hypothetical protein
MLLSENQIVITYTPQLKSIPPIKAGLDIAAPLDRPSRSTTFNYHEPPKWSSKLTNQLAWRQD